MHNIVGWVLTGLCVAGVLGTIAAMIASAVRREREDRQWYGC